MSVHLASQMSERLAGQGTGNALYEAHAQLLVSGGCGSIGSNHSSSLASLMDMGRAECTTGTLPCIVAPMMGPWWVSKPSGMSEALPSTLRCSSSSSTSSSSNKSRRRVHPTSSLRVPGLRRSNSEYISSGLRDVSRTGDTITSQSTYLRIACGGPMRSCAGREEEEEVAEVHRH